MIDVNDASEQRDFSTIPDGTFVKIIGHIRPGGLSQPGMDPMDNGLFTGSTKSDAIMLSFEFTVAQGQYQHRKIFENFVVAGGSVDEKGVSKGWNMTKSRIRAMLESAQNIDPKDMSPAAKQARVIQGFKQLDGIPFYAKLRIEEGGERPGGGSYADKNVIDRIVVPGDAEYADLVAGKDVAPKPSGRAPSRGNGAAAPQGALPLQPKGPAWASPTPSAGSPAPASSAATTTAPAAASSTSAPKGPAWLSR